MFPFRIRYSNTIDKSINPEQFDSILNNIETLLKNKGADFFSKENNRLIFDNKFFKWVSTMNIMAYVDGGFVEIKQTKKNKTKITYGITLISVWIISTIFSSIILFSTKSLTIALVAFSFLGILTWIVSVLRHWSLLFTMTDKMKSMI
jgi:hypothetical protein